MAARTTDIKKEVSMECESIILQGGTVVCEHEVLPHHDVVVVGGRIEAIRPSTAGGHFSGREAVRFPGREDLGEMSLIDSAQSIIDEAAGFGDDLWPTGQGLRQGPQGPQDGPRQGPIVVDARGCYVLPGIIDIHSDFIESVASPRPGVVMDLSAALYKAERELVAHGVTTIYHSLSIYQSTVFDHKPIRSFENVSALIALIQAMRQGEERDHLIRHRLHLRVEVDAFNMYEAVKDYLSRGLIDLLSFMDHTPGQGQYADLKVYGDTLKGYRNLSDEDVARIIAEKQAADKLSMAQLLELSRMARAQGIALASHDDDSCEKLDLMEQLETSISEFPITLDVAQSARKRGMHTLAGAPNVLLGRSHSANLSAREAVCADMVDVLCSDYYPAALLSSAFILHRHCGIGLARAVALISINPARAVRLDKDFGSIAVGKRADMLCVREIGGDIPVVAQAFVGGRCVHQSHYPQFEAPLEGGHEGPGAGVRAVREEAEVR
jgi:alpha-D-ribose 1-methylphosphonate 5-triphosphate diphosphatase